MIPKLTINPKDNKTKLLVKKYITNEIAKLNVIKLVRIATSFFKSKFNFSIFSLNFFMFSFSFIYES